MEKLNEIIEAAKLILSVCDGAINRDEEGYDIFDAGHFRGFLYYPDLFGVESLTPEEVEFMRRKLLRYKKQLQERGFDPSVLDNPVHSVSFFAHAKDWKGKWFRVSPRSLVEHFPEIARDLREVERRNSWVQISISYHRDKGPVKQIWVRFNDPDGNGKTRKWWEGSASAEV